MWLAVWLTNNWCLYVARNMRCQADYWWPTSLISRYFDWHARQEKKQREVQKFMYTKSNHVILRKQLWSLEKRWAQAFFASEITHLCQFLKPFFIFWWLQLQDFEYHSDAMATLYHRWTPVLHMSVMLSKNKNKKQASGQTNVIIPHADDHNHRHHSGALTLLKDGWLWIHLPCGNFLATDL